MIGLILALSVAIAPAPSPNFPPDKKCDSGDDRETAACVEEQYQAWDMALNAEYKSLLTSLPAEIRPKLVKSQRTWIQYRDANCAMRADPQHIAAIYFTNMCLLNMTRDRTKELHGLPDEVEG